MQTEPSHHRSFTAETQRHLKGLWQVQAPGLSRPASGTAPATAAGISDRDCDRSQGPEQRSRQPGWLSLHHPDGRGVATGILPVDGIARIHSQSGNEAIAFIGTCGVRSCVGSTNRHRGALGTTTLPGTPRGARCGLLSRLRGRSPALHRRGCSPFNPRSAGERVRPSSRSEDGSDRSQARVGRGAQGALAINPRATTPMVRRWGAETTSQRTRRPAMRSG
jgi:hypothetical protein